jgi:hypothetical protein
MSRNSVLTIFALLLSLGPRAFARKAPAVQDRDRIEVICHLAFDGTGVTGVLTGEHWRRNYVYLTTAGKIIVVDVTTASKAKITAEHPMESAQARVDLVVGGVALIADAPPPSSTVPRSISILSFENSAKPTVVHRFENLTGYHMDARRGLIYIVNPEGLWILSPQPARDREAEEEYDRYLLYNR